MNRRFFTPDQVSGDLNELLAAFADIHPNPFWSRSEAQFRQDIEKIAASAKARKGMSEPEFFKTVARLVIAFDDPHCWAFVPGWKEYRDGGGRFFPLDLRFTDGGATRVAAGDSRLLGAEALAVNGAPLKTLYAEYRPLTGQADDPYGDEFLARFFRRYLWYFHGWGERVALRIRDGRGERTVTVDGIDQKAYEKRDAETEGERALSYRPLQRGAGLLIFRSCVAPEKVRALAEPIFRKIQETGVTRLVVDDRENPGGGDDGWHALLGFLTDRPFRAYNGSRYRISQRLKNLLGEKEITNGYADGAWTAPPGKEFAVRYGDDDLIRPAPEPLRFKGNWCLLAGRGSFSAGMSFVCAVKAYKLAPVIGEETGGRVKGFGQWVEAPLPQTGLSVAISTKQFDGAVDVPFRRGVPPDLRVRPAKGVAPNSSGDPVLRAALDILDGLNGKRKESLRPA